jgi:hypothetical protein
MGNVAVEIVSFLPIINVNLAIPHVCNVKTTKVMDVLLVLSDSQLMENVPVQHPLIQICTSVNLVMNHVQVVHKEINQHSVIPVQKMQLYHRVVVHAQQITS